MLPAIRASWRHARRSLAFSQPGSSRRAPNPSRPRGLGALAAGLRETAAQAQDGTADVILFNGRITTLDRQNPQAQAMAIRGDRFVAAGTEQDIMRLAGSGTQRIDLKGRRVIPGLI